MQPIGLRLAAFAARAQGTSVILVWQTVSEVGIAGFQVLRTGAEGDVIILQEALAAQHSGASQRAAYIFVDDSAQPGAAYRYALAIAGLDGRVDVVAWEDVLAPRAAIFLPFLTIDGRP